LSCLAAVLLCASVAPEEIRAASRHRGPPAAYAPNQVVVAYAKGTATAARAGTAETQPASGGGETSASVQVMHLGNGATVPGEIARLRHTRGVLWAVPDYVARFSRAPFIPNDPGEAGVAGGWQDLQWNFVGQWGVNAPQAWGNVAGDNAYGGRGVIVAVLDTGVAYRDRGPFLRSPDFRRSEFIRGYDFVSGTPFPDDANGHGTFVAGTIAEATNNKFGLTGLSYGVRIMPVRVLDTAGEGDASTIAEGVRYAVNHHAKVINMSLEFSPEVTASDIPELISALRYANRHGVLVVAAAGNEGSSTVPYPARGPDVVAVGATTEHGCMANYSNYGKQVTLVAPGGGPDANLPGDPNCHPNLPPGRDVYQMTFTGTSPRHFGFPSGYEGTSMATPHVAATAALIIASGVIGRHPTPAQITERLVRTARKLGDPQDAEMYGAGLLNAAAATARGPIGVANKQ
jgi:serine protease